MAAIAAERNLLFGLLALQIGLINQGQFVAVFQTWTLDKNRALADHLVGRGDLHTDDRYAVEALVARHLKVPLRAFRPDAPEGIERILLKALQKQPQDRWKSAQAMADALRPSATRLSP
jgi:hypothetical protein